MLMGSLRMGVLGKSGLAFPVLMTFADLCGEFFKAFLSGEEWPEGSVCVRVRTADGFSTGGVASVWFVDSDLDDRSMTSPFISFVQDSCFLQCFDCAAFKEFF